MKLFLKKKRNLRSLFIEISEFPDIRVSNKAALTNVAMRFMVGTDKFERSIKGRRISVSSSAFVPITCMTFLLILAVWFLSS